MRKKIMVVDDEPDQILTVKVVLEDMDNEYEVIGATDGKKCFDILQKGHLPDLILLDIMMPILDGWQIAAELKKNSEWRKIPIVFLTAKKDGFSRTFGGMFGADYIMKPFEIMDLKNKIDNVLKN